MKVHDMFQRIHIKSAILLSSSSFCVPDARDSAKLNQAAVS